MPFTAASHAASTTSHEGRQTRIFGPSSHTQDGTLQCRLGPSISSELGLAYLGGMRQGSPGPSVPGVQGCSATFLDPIPRCAGGVIGWRALWCGRHASWLIRIGEERVLDSLSEPGQHGKGVRLVCRHCDGRRASRVSPRLLNPPPPPPNQSALSFYNWSHLNFTCFP